jgi:hypothetical protein
MVDGAIKKFAKENALLSQVFVMDNKTAIADVVAQAGKAAGTAIVLKDYVRFQLGEGIEKEASDFAAEVAAGGRGLNGPQSFELVERRRRSVAAAVFVRVGGVLVDQVHRRRALYGAPPKGGAPLVRESEQCQRAGE